MNRYFLLVNFLRFINKEFFSYFIEENKNFCSNKEKEPVL